MAGTTKMIMTDGQYNDWVNLVIRCAIENTMPTEEFLQAYRQYERMCERSREEPVFYSVTVGWVDGD